MAIAGIPLGSSGENLAKHGFVDVDVHEHLFSVGFKSEEFVELFGGPSMKGVLGLFWEKEQVDKYVDKLGPAMEQMFAEKKIETPEIKGTVWIAKAKKA